MWVVFRSWFLIATFFVLVQGCALAPVQKRVSFDEPSLQILREQQFLLAQYSEVLDELLVTHSEITTKVDRLQQDVARVNHLVSSENRGSKSSLSKTDLTKMVVKKESIEIPPVVMSKVTLGRYEWVWFDLLAGAIKARVDTGVQNSLIECSNIQLFERDGDKWVRFSMTDMSEGQFFESPVARRAKTKQGTEGDRRTVVKLAVRIGEITEQAEFTLVDYKGSSYPVTLGRNFLRDIALVDVAKKFTQAKYTPKVSP